MAEESNFTLNIPGLPLLDALASLVDDRVDFSNTVLVGIQHLVANTVPLMEKLKEAGLQR